MLEQMKSVSNPLTIIALFSALAEIAGTVAIKFVAPELQPTFIWFVMLFPVLIAVLFFATLNFNAKALYAPSDFRNEENYITVLNAKQSLGIEKVETMIATAKTEIINDVQKMIPANGTGDQNEVEKIVNEKLQPVQDAVEAVKDAAIEKLFPVPRIHSDRRIQKYRHILNVLSYEKKPMTAAEIAKLAGMNIDFTNKILSDLVSVGVVTMPLSGKGGVRFALNNSIER